MTEHHDHTEHHFYGFPIYRQRQEDYIKKLLQPYQNKPVSDDLKKEVWDLLQYEKYLGNITIPFKLAVRLDPTGKFPNLIEVILDTKV